MTKQRSISTFSTIALLLVLATTMQSLLLRCGDSCASTTQIEQHHDCCHCTEHISECKQHTTRLNHDCKASQATIVEYIVSPSQTSLEHDSTLHETLQFTEPNNLSLKAAIYTINRTRPKWKETIVSSFDPGCSALRAPPVLV